MVFEEARRLANAEGLPAEIGDILLAPNMRVRLTHNVNKEEGYANSNTGQARKVLCKDAFIQESSQHTCSLVYPITVRGRKYLPVTYGYASTGTEPRSDRLTFRSSHAPQRNL